LSRGKTLGKLALGIRVISDDGSPERFRQALIRALAAAFLEIWLVPFNLIGMPAGLITSMVSARGKRLGDMFAGTFVIQERVPKRRDMDPVFAMVAPPLIEWSRHLELATLPDQTAATASSYLRRYRDLRPAARAHLGPRIAAEVAAYVSPPPPAGAPPEAYLAAVLAVRRDREQARLRQWQPTAAGEQGFAQPGFGPSGFEPSGFTQPGSTQPGFTQPGFGPTLYGPAVAADRPGPQVGEAARSGQPADPPSEDFGFAAPF
jgi:hypothetical protein